MRWRLLSANGPHDDFPGDAAKVCSVYEQVPVMLVGLDGPRLTFSAANAAYRALYPDLVLGTSVFDSFPELLGQQVLEKFVEVYQTGQPLNAREWRVQMDFGSGVQEFFFDMLISPRFDSDGAVAGVIVHGQDATDRVMVRRAAEARAQAMQDRYETVRDAAAVMQQALLSPVIPVLPGTDIAAAYLVATEDTAAGGDWFDVVTSADGAVFTVVGDVVGHGIEAAAVMAQLRTALRMQLHAGADISEALSALDEFASEIPGADSATICVLRLQPDSGNFEYCTAGHPPPLIIAADGTACYLQPTGASPLGHRPGFASAAGNLADGAVVLLYSDGLIERPGRRPPASTAEVADVTARVLRGAAGFPMDPQQTAVQRICSQAVEMLVRPTGYSDDITMLAMQRRTPPPNLRLEVAANRDAERAVRTALRDWLEALGGDFVSGQLLEHAVSEFVANAAEHAYAGTAAGMVTVEGTLSARGRISVHVSDRGTWQVSTETASDRGRGLSIAQALVADTAVNRTENGTTISAVHRLTRAAHIVADPRTTFPASATPVTTFGATAEKGLITVVGDVDTGSAATLAGVMATHSQVNTSPLTVDLSSVTHLGSAAVSVLAEAMRRAKLHGTDCTLVAPPGSTAHHVLTLVGLPTSRTTHSD